MHGVSVAIKGKKDSLILEKRNTNTLKEIREKLGLFVCYL